VEKGKKKKWEGEGNKKEEKQGLRLRGVKEGLDGGEYKGRREAERGSEEGKV